MYNSYSNELTHHGVKGMKWGVRRGSKKPNKGANQSKTKKQNKSASDAEAKRIKAERGKKVAKGILKGVGIGAAVVGTAAVANIAAKYAVASMAGQFAKELGEMLANH